MDLAEIPVEQPMKFELEWISKRQADRRHDSAVGAVSGRPRAQIGASQEALKS
jgi:hypothetical protein